MAESRSDGRDATHYNGKTPASLPGSSSSILRESRDEGGSERYSVDKIIDVAIAEEMKGTAEDLKDELPWFQKNKIWLTSDIWLGYPVGTPEMMRQCERRGLPSPPNGAFYVLVNESPAKPTLFDWDPDERLAEIIVFSRIVHPTAFGYDYCARVWLSDDGRPRNILPPRTAGARAYTVNGDRPWLTRDEWSQVGRLVEQWRTSDANKCKRFRSAIWYREKIAQEYYLDVRWCLLVTAIECLIGVGFGKTRVGRGKQFRHGCVELASTCESVLSETEAHEAWHRRSSLVHGQGWPTGALRNDKPEDDLYERLEGILDAAIRKGISDPAFRAHFSSDDELLSWLRHSP